MLTGDWDVCRSTGLKTSHVCSNCAYYLSKIHILHSLYSVWPLVMQWQHNVMRSLHVTIVWLLRDRFVFINAWAFQTPATTLTCYQWTCGVSKQVFWNGSRLPCCSCLDLCETCCQHQNAIIQKSMRSAHKIWQANYHILLYWCFQCSHFLSFEFGSHT